MTDKFKINFKYAFRIHKPVLVLRLVWTWILVSIFGKRPLRYVDTAIGYKCNLSCEHCFAKDKIDRRRGRMPPHYFKSVAKQCMKLGAVNFSFQGGEPLLYQDLKHFVKAARPYKNLISITTNGTLLTPEKCRELRSWGVDIITLSVDQHRKQINWVRLIDTIRASGMNVTIGTAVTHQDIDSLKNLNNPDLKFLIHYTRSKQVILMLIYAVPMGGFAGQDVMLRPEDVAYIKDLCSRVPYVRTDFQANWIDEGCGCCKEIIFINPYGDVYPCPFIDIPFGNLKDTSIKKIREKMLCEKMFQGYSQHCIAGEGKGIRSAF